MCSATCSHVTVLDIAVSAEWFQCWGRNQREAVRRQEDEEDGRIAATAATFKAPQSNGKMRVERDSVAMMAF